MDTAETTRAIAEHVALNPLDPKDLVSTFGLIGVWAVLFAETGLLAGFFFPGDSMLFLAGVAASSVADQIFGDGTRMSLIGLLIGAPVCAVLGAQLGHHLGARYGSRLFDRPNSRLFKREYVDKAEYYFEKFGPAKAVVLARFIPIVRTFLNPVAGMLGMPARSFLLWNLIGGVLWTDGIILTGYLLAHQIIDAVPDGKIDKYILPVVFLIVLISVLPIFIEIIRERRARSRGERPAWADRSAGSDGDGPERPGARSAGEGGSGNGGTGSAVGRYHVGPVLPEEAHQPVGPQPGRVYGAATPPGADRYAEPTGRFTAAPAGWPAADARRTGDGQAGPGAGRPFAPADPYPTPGDPYRVPADPYQLPSDPYQAGRPAHHDPQPGPYGSPPDRRYPQPDPHGAPPPDGRYGAPPPPPHERYDEPTDYRGGPVPPYQGR